MSQQYPSDNGNQQRNDQQQLYQQPPQPQYQQQYMSPQVPQYPPAQQPVGQPAPYPQQQYAPQGYMQQPIPMMNTNINVNVQQSGPGFLVRALYFCFIGWWAGFFWLNLGFFLCALIVTLPVGLIMLNRLPQVMTLKPAGTKTNVNVSTITAMPSYPNGPVMMQQNINITVGGTQQHNFLLRALYYIFIGCWVGYLWANLAYACCLTIVLLPVGVMMFDRLPAVLTLRKN